MLYTAGGVVHATHERILGLLSERKNAGSMSAAEYEERRLVLEGGKGDNYANAELVALKERFGGRSWVEWPEPIRRRDPGALAAVEAEPEVADRIALEEIYIPARKTDIAVDAVALAWVPERTA